MKQSLSTLFLLFFTFYFSQNQLQILNSKTQKPLYNASVYCDDQLLGKTDTNGNLSFKTKCKKVEIITNNFEDKEVEVKKEMKVFLQPTSEKVEKIGRVVITDKSDPRALKMLDELEKRFKENSPKSLDSYTFFSYSKISIDIDKDTINTYKKFMERRKDSLANLKTTLPKQKEKEIKDSLIGDDFENTLKESQMFLWEKVTENKFSKKYGEKTNIVDNRMSGFQNPIYEAMAMNISNLNRIPRQIRPENRNRYHYYLSDTLVIDGRKTYVIKFKEITDKQKQNPRKFNGKIYIDAENYALKKIESKSKKQNEGDVVSVWKPIEKKWFLDHEILKIKMGEQSFKIAKKDSIKPDEKRKYVTKNFGNYLYVKNNYFDFTINQPQEAKDYTGYSLEVKNTDGKLLEQYRTDTLTTREANTYTKIDQFVEKHHFDKKVSVFTNLMKGNYRYKMLDFDLTKLFDYNKYEVIRLGVGVKLNEKFSKIVSPDFYLGYGFKDHFWKFGTGIDFKLSTKRTSVFRIEYSDDVFAAGRFSKNLWNNRMKLVDQGIDLYNANFYRNRQFGTSYLYDLTNSLTFKLALSKERQNALFDYHYKNFENDFNNFSTTLSFKYSPNDKNLMTPAGKYTYETNFPQFFVNFEKGSKWLGGNLDYSKWDALIIHQIKTKIGTTHFKIYGGISSGTAPIWKKFEITGQTDAQNTHWYNKINTPSNIGFVTMPSGTFYADKFIAFKISHYLPFYFKTIGKRFSSISLEYQSAVGGFKNPEDHLFNFQVLDHNYQELGLIWNRFLGMSFGVGFSYRMGYYQTDTFQNNFGIILKL